MNVVMNGGRGSVNVDKLLNPHTVGRQSWLSPSPRGRAHHTKRRKGWG